MNVRCRNVHKLVDIYNTISCYTFDNEIIRKINLTFLILKHFLWFFKLKVILNLFNFLFQTIYSVPSSVQ